MERQHEFDQRKEDRRQVEHDTAHEPETAKDRDRYTAAVTQIESDLATIHLARRGISCLRALSPVTRPYCQPIH